MTYSENTIWIDKLTNLIGINGRIRCTSKKSNEGASQLFLPSKPSTHAGPLPTEIQNDGMFIYKATSSGNAWLMGTGIEKPNPCAIATSRCPDEIIIPGKIAYQGNDYPVEEIGITAFYSCGLDYGSTKTVFLPKEVKIIREYGFSKLNTVNNFTIEAGSQLNTIEYGGLSRLGWKLYR